MYVSMSRLRVAAAQSDALVAAFRRRAHPVDSAQALSMSRSGAPIATWGSADGLSLARSGGVHRLYAKPAYRVSHGRIDPSLKDAIRLERLAQLRDGRRVSRPVAPPSGWPAPTTATLAGPDRSRYPRS